MNAENVASLKLEYWDDDSWHVRDKNGKEYTTTNLIAIIKVQKSIIDMVLGWCSGYKDGCKDCPEIDKSCDIKLIADSVKEELTKLG